MAGSKAFELRYPTLKDVEDLARDIRLDDLIEQQAVSSLMVYDDIRYGIERSKDVYSVYLHEKLAGIWGIIDQTQGVLEPTVGGGWLLTTPVVDRYPKAFWWASLRILDELLDTWDEIYNWIDLRHAKALRWGWRLGFDFSNPEKMGSMGEEFVKFVITRNGFDNRAERRGTKCVLQQLSQPS